MSGSPPSEVPLGQIAVRGAFAPVVGRPVRPPCIPAAAQLAERLQRAALRPACVGAVRKLQLGSLVVSTPGLRRRCQGLFSDDPLRTATTTSWIAWVTAAVCAGLSTRESWVEPGTTRCTLLVDRATDWFWSAIHPFALPLAAVRTTSGFAAKSWSWPASASDRLATPNSSMKPPISFPVAAVVRASSRYLGDRYANSLLAMIRPTPSRDVVAA